MGQGAKITEPAPAKMGGQSVRPTAMPPLTKMKNILSKILFCPPEFVNNVLLHIPVGLFNAILIRESGWLTLLFGVGFLTYEISEQKKIGDTAFQDIKGWLWGLAYMGVILLCI